MGTDPSAVRPSSGTAPYRLEVASRGIDLPIVPVGVTKTQEMELPDTVQQVGWYRYGPRPADQQGVTVLAAHVDTRRDGIGPFARLRDVRIGAEVVLTTAGGRPLRYQITDVRRIAKRSVPLDEVFRRDGPATLALITCGGQYDQGVGYRDNVIVTAEPRQ